MLSNGNDNNKMPEDFIRPDLPSRCTWSRKANDLENPHTKRPL